MLIMFYQEAMTQTAAITEAITTLQDAENRFDFIRVEDEKFFPEWYEGLSEITELKLTSKFIKVRINKSFGFLSSDSD